MIMAPLVYGRKGEHKDIIENMRRSGYARMLVDGELRTLDEDITLDKKKKHRLSVVVDRMSVREGIRQRLSDSVETALKLADGRIEVQVIGGETKVYSEKFACPDCEISLPEIEPRLFSFNAPYGACPTCGGLGIKREYDWELILPDKNKSFADGAIAALSTNPAAFTTRLLTAFFTGQRVYAGQLLERPCPGNAGKVKVGRRRGELSFRLYQPKRGYQ